VLIDLSDDRFFATSDTQGLLLVPNVPIGKYQVYASSQWYMPRIVNEVNMEPGKTVFVRMKLYAWDPKEERFNERYRMPLFVPDSSIHYR